MRKIHKKRLFFFFEHYKPLKGGIIWVYSRTGRADIRTARQSGRAAADKLTDDRKGAVRC